MSTCRSAPWCADAAATERPGRFAERTPGSACSAPEGLPARVGLQFGLEQGGDAVRNIIGFHTACRLLLPKQRDPLVQVAAVIGDDLHRHTGALGDLAQHRGDPLPGAVRRHLHGEHLHGPVRRAVAGLEQPGGGDAQNHETLRCAQFKRMIGDVNPILAPLRRLQEDRQSAAINPVEDRRMRRQAHRHPAREQTQYAGHPAAAESGTQKHLQRQLNDQERMPVTGRQAQLLPSRSVRLLRRADRCRLRRRRRATALRRHARFSIGLARFQIPDLDPSRAQALLLVQGFGPRWVLCSRWMHGRYSGGSGIRLVSFRASFVTQAGGGTGRGAPGEA